MGTAWLIYTIALGKNISFLNESIKYQFPVQTACVVLKYVVLQLNGFKSKKAFFYFNVCVYIVYVAISFSLDAIF